MRAIALGRTACVGVVGPKHLFRQVTKTTHSRQFGLASIVHPVEQVANRLHHGVWAVDVECGVRSVFQHAVFTVAHGIGNGPVDGQLDVVQLVLRGFGREHRPKWIDAHACEHNQRDIGHVAAAADLVADALEVLGLFQPDAPRFEVVFEEQIADRRRPVGNLGIMQHTVATTGPELRRLPS